MTLFRNRARWYKRTRYTFGIEYAGYPDSREVRAHSRQYDVALIRSGLAQMERAVVARLAAGDLPQREDVAHLPIRERHVVWHAPHGTEYDVSAAQFRALCGEWLEETEVAHAA